jgi:hypothetical protein
MSNTVERLLHHATGAGHLMTIETIVAQVERLGTLASDMMDIAPVRTVSGGAGDWKYR